VRGPLAPYAEGFRVELERLGYTPLTAATHVRLLAHLSRWLAREGVDGSGLTPAVVDAYFAERRAAGYVGHVTGRALQPLLGYLQRLGVVSVPAPEVPASPEGRLLASYRDYLTHSPLWLQIHADTIGAPLALTEVSDAPALGCAILAAHGAERFGSIEEGAEAMVRTARTIEPNAANAQRYESFYPQYRELCVRDRLQVQASTAEVPRLECNADRT